MENGLIDGSIPRLDTVRRVPGRFHQTFPLWLMKRCQCVVLGGAQGALTVAIVDGQQAMIKSLEKLTGHTIFTVIIDPAKMGLLISRIERQEWQKRNKKLLGRPCYMHYIQLHSILSYLVTLPSPKGRRITT